MIDFLPHIEYVWRAHREKSLVSGNSVRLWDKQTPYSIHPIWCATTLLTETSLDENIRVDGALALLYHDILEDTSAKLPKGLPNKVVHLVREMTFTGGFAEELISLPQKELPVQLYKLFDKTSNLLDVAWMDNSLYRQYFNFTQSLCDRVENGLGKLNIVRICRSLPEKQL